MYGSDGSEVVNMAKKPTKTEFSLVASKGHGRLSPARNILYQVSFVIPRDSLILYIVDIKISY